MSKKRKTTVSGNIFQGVVWDSKAIEGVNAVAKALLNLTEVYKAQGIQIDCLLKVEAPELKKIKSSKN